MTVEEIVTERQKLASEVLDGSKAEMVKIGLTVDSLQIQSIDDLNSGYIDAMAAPHTAAIQRQAQIAQAQANQAAAQASRSRSASRPSTRGRPPWSRPSTRPKSIKRRPRRPRQDRSARHRPRSGHQRPGGTGPAARPSCVSASWWPSGQPAEAEAEKVRVLAKADAERMRILAEAAASNDRRCTGPDAHRPAPADRQGSSGRPGQRERQRAQRADGLSEIGPAWSARG